MKRKIDIENWKRKAHYNLFSNFDHPYLTINANIECRKLYDHCKEHGISFFIAYLHISNLVTNDIPEFKLRVEENDVYEYDIIHASPTIARDDDTFGFAYPQTENDFAVFNKTASVEIERVKKLRTLEVKPDLNLIYYSILPGLSFTQIQHPEVHSKSMSIPKIVFGKMDKATKNYLMPISVSINHALADGLHVNKYFNLMKKYILNCEKVIKL